MQPLSFLLSFPSPSHLRHVGALAVLDHVGRAAAHELGRDDGVGVDHVAEALHRPADVGGQVGPDGGVGEGRVLLAGGGGRVDELRGRLGDGEVGRVGLAGAGGGRVAEGGRRDPLAEGVEAGLVDLGQVRGRVRHGHVEGGGGDDDGGREVGDGALAHAVLEVAVLGGEPDFPVPGDVGGDAEAVGAPGGADDEAGLFVDLEDAVGAEVVDDGERPGSDAAHVGLGRGGDLALLHGLLEDEGGEDEVLLRRRARADEGAVELHALGRELRDGPAVVRGREEGDLGDNVAEVDGVAKRVLGALVGPEVEALLVVGLAGREHAGRLFVGLEDSRDAAELGGHVGDGEAGVGGHEAEARAAPLDGALVGDRVALEDAEDVEDNVLAADAELGLADELDQARLRDLEPRVAGDEGEGDVARAEADGEGAHAAPGAGVGVGADDNLPRLGALAGELGVHDGGVGPPVVGDARLGGELVGELDEGGGLGLAGGKRKSEEGWGEGGRGKGEG
jgi:hypothetical protein